MTFLHPDPAASTGADSVLGELLERLASQLRAGEAVTLEDFVALWPEQEAEIRGLYPAIAAMVRMGADSPSHAATSQNSLLEASSIISRPSRHRLGDFQILREVGRGGMGVVYEAEQLSLGRRVALKVLPFAAMLDERLLKRFKNEAAAATLDHPHIVSVHFIGCERGIHFFAMQFVDGQTLEEVIERLKADMRAGSTTTEMATPTPHVALPKTSQDEQTAIADTEDRAEEKEGSSLGSWLPGDAWKSSRRNVGDNAAIRTRARAKDSTSSLSAGGSLYHRIAQLAAQAADAVEHAHQQRIIHRDLKPSNLMLDEHGHIWVTDFGLATTHGDSNLTLTGDLIGTLRYSSPEQARGGVVDHRTDIYSLGITLYELLALRPAFETHDRHQLLDHILQREPPRLRRVRPDLPVDLEVIVHKAIAKDPQERYQTAREFADDLRRFLSHQPIRARPPAVWETAVKWVRRRPGVALVMLGASLAAVAVAIALSIYTVQLRGAYARLKELDQADLHRQSQIHRGMVYPASISAAAAAIDQRDFATARRALDACNPAKPGVADPCGFEWSLLENRTRTPHLQWTLSGSGAPVLSVAISPDGDLAATGDKTGIVSLWDLRNGQRIKSWRPFTGETRVAFSPRGTWLTAASDYQDGRVALWNMNDLKEVANFAAHDGTIYSLAFSPDEEWLATGGRERTIKLWKLTDLMAARKRGETAFQPQRQIEARGVIYDLQVSPDGTWLVSCEKQERLRVWNMADGSLKSTICEFPTEDSFQACSLLAGGNICVAGGYSDALRFFDVPSRREIASFDVHDSIFDIAVSPDERKIAAVCDDGSVTIWQSDGPSFGRMQRVCFGAHQRRIREVAFSHDNRLLLTASDDGTAKVWKLDSLPAPDVSLINLRLKDGVRQACYDPAGKWLAVLGHDGIIRVLDAKNLSLTTELSAPGKHFDEVLFDPPGHRLVATAGNEAIAWTTTDWKESSSITVPGDRILCAFGDYDDALLTLNSADGDHCTLSVWELHSGTRVRTINLGPNLPTCVARSPSGSVLAVGVHPAKLLLIDLVTFEPREVALPVHSASHLAFDSRGKRLTAVGNGNRFCLVDVQEAKVLSYHRISASEISAIAFTAEERLLAIADQNQRCIHFWDEETSRVLFTLDTLQFRPQGVALSPDGRSLITATSQSSPQGLSGVIHWDLFPPGVRE